MGVLNLRFPWRQRNNHEKYGRHTACILPRTDNVTITKLCSYIIETQLWVTKYRGMSATVIDRAVFSILSRQWSRTHRKKYRTPCASCSLSFSLSIYMIFHLFVHIYTCPAKIWKQRMISCAILCEMMCNRRNHYGVKIWTHVRYYWPFWGASACYPWILSTNVQ